ncbi:MAG TPA: FAD-dependent oxidoreductase, partial [Steroidobacteraceae bacterium]
MSIDLLVPDLGNFSDVEVVDVLVKPGDVVELDTPLVTLETDKASLDVPATAAGKISEVLLKRGDKVSKGSLIARMQAAAGTQSAAAAPAEQTTAAPAPSPPAASPPPAARTAPPGAGDTVRMPAPAARAAPAREGVSRSTQLLVLGSGPGGYTAAFRAADLGLKVILVERDEALGGVCLNVGCIPSKALLHAAKVIEDAQEMGERGITFGVPKIELPKLRAWKCAIVAKLTGGLKLLARQRKVEILRGTGRFVSANVMEVTGTSGSDRIGFEQCIIAAGSEAVRLPGLPDDRRIIDSTGALELPEIKGALLV